MNHPSLSDQHAAPVLNIVYVSPTPDEASSETLRVMRDTLPLRERFAINIGSILAVASLEDAATVIADNQDAADFTLIDLDAKATAASIIKLEAQLVAQPKASTFFFASRAPTPHATQMLPTVRYAQLGQLATLTVQDIVAARVKRQAVVQKPRHGLPVPFGKQVHSG